MWMPTFTSLFLVASSCCPYIFNILLYIFRPVKTLRHDSPLVAETWLTDLQTGGDKNKYQFIPTQLRTQPANLPKPGELIVKQ